MTLVTFSGLMMAQSSQEELIKEIVQEKLISNKHFSSVEGTTDNTVRGAVEYKFTSKTSQTEMEGEPTIAINPNNPNNVVVSFMNFTQGGLALPIYVSQDGGESWVLSSFNTVNHYNNDPSRTGTSIAGGGDPILEFDEEGNLYFMWIYLGLDATFTGIWHNFWAVSKDGGLNFSTLSSGDDVWNKGGLNLITGQLTTEGDGIFDRHWLAVDNSGGPFHGSLYVAGLFLGNSVTTLGATGMVIKAKRANASTFERRHVNLYSSQLSQFANLKVDENGWVHIVYGSIDDLKIIYQVSKDGGVSFSAPSFVGDFEWLTRGMRQVHDRENAAPSLYASGNDIIVSWTSNTTNPEGMVARSSNGGLDWTTSKISDLIPNSNYDGVMWPVVAAQDRQVSLFFYALSGKRGDYCVMSSNNFGGSFENFEILSGASTRFDNYTINNQANETFFGDYNNAVMADGRSFVVYSDGRSSQGPKVYLSIVENDGSVSSRSVFGDDRLIITPNPANEAWTLSFDSPEDGNGKIKVINMSGQLALESNVSFTSGINKWSPNSKLTPGNYLVHLHFGNDILIAPLIIVE